MGSDLCNEFDKGRIKLGSNKMARAWAMLKWAKLFWVVPIWPNSVRLEFYTLDYR